MGLKFPKPKQQVDHRYRAWIRMQPSIVSGKIPCEAAHIKTRGARGDDYNNLVPLTKYEHQKLHSLGIATFQKRYHVNLGAYAERMYRKYIAGKYFIVM